MIRFVLFLTLCALSPRGFYSFLIHFTGSSFNIVLHPLAFYPVSIQIADNSISIFDYGPKINTIGFISIHASECTRMWLYNSTKFEYHIFFFEGNLTIYLKLHRDSRQSRNNILLPRYTFLTLLIFPTFVLCTYNVNGRHCMSCGPYIE